MFSFRMGWKAGAVALALVASSWTALASRKAPAAASERMLNAEGGEVLALEILASLGRIYDWPPLM